MIHLMSLVIMSHKIYIWPSLGLLKSQKNIFLDIEGVLNNADTAGGCCIDDYIYIYIYILFQAAIYRPYICNDFFSIAQQRLDYACNFRSRVARELGAAS